MAEESQQGWSAEEKTSKYGDHSSHFTDGKATSEQGISQQYRREEVERYPEA